MGSPPKSFTIVPEFTVVVAVDARTVNQWRGTWQTWRHFHPDILDRPLLVIADAWAADESAWESTDSGWASTDSPAGTRQSPAGTGQTDYWIHRLRWLDHPNWSLALWDWPRGNGGCSAGTPGTPITQRERMLTAYCRVPGAVVDTEYWLKIDTDAVATAAVPWVDPEWFTGQPSLIASPWSYTKPAAWLVDLERWAGHVDLLSALPPLDLRADPANRTHRHARIASWICFVDTVWSHRVGEYAPDRLPVPSQDTFHWYCAARRGDVIRRVKFKKFGWTNVSSNRVREKMVAQLLRGEHGSD